MYKELMLFEGYHFVVGEHFKDEIVKKIDVLKGDYGWYYIVYMESGKEYNIPESSTLWNVMY